MTPNNNILQEFLNTFDLKNIVNEPTCFKGKPSCIDLILTTRKNYFKKIKTIVTGISDFHKLVIGSLRSTFTKGNPKTKSYRDYKNFDSMNFGSNLYDNLSSIRDINYNKFENTFKETLNHHAPIK